MSEPRHIYAWTEWHGVPIVVAVSDRADAGPDAKRHTLTDGPEYRALIERAREELRDGSGLSRYRLIADVLAWLEGTP